MFPFGFWQRFCGCRHVRSRPEPDIQRLVERSKPILGLGPGFIVGTNRSDNYPAPGRYLNSIFPATNPSPSNLFPSISTADPPPKSPKPPSSKRVLSLSSTACPFTKNTPLLHGESVHSVTNPSSSF